jgi:hypothetical protein
MPPESCALRKELIPNYANVRRKRFLAVPHDTLKNHPAGGISYKTHPRACMNPTSNKPEVIVDPPLN